MKVIFFNRFFFPDTSATSQMVSDIAFGLSSHDYEVHVVTSLSQPELARFETIHGVTVHRVSYSAKRTSLVLKAVDYVRYYFGARRVAKNILSRGDVAVVKTDPPLLIAAIGPIALRRGAKLANWLQDIFPEIAREYGIPGARLRAIKLLRDKWLRRSDCSVAICDAMKERVVQESGVDRTSIWVIHNWARGSDITPIQPDASPLRHEWGLRGRFVVGYSGNLGRVHEFETILSAAAMLSDRSDVSFVIIGSGPKHNDVRSAVERRRLPNVQFHPLQTRASLSDSLGLPDVHLCVLRPEFESLVVPSKIYGILAAGRPQIYIGEPSAEMPRLLESEQAGICVKTGDAKALRDAILRLQSDPSLTADMGLRARALFDREFDFPVAMRKWEAVLAELRLQRKAAV